HFSCLCVVELGSLQICIFLHFPEVYVLGAARPAVWCNAPCFLSFWIFLLASARRAWVGGATRSLELYRVVLLLIVARRAGVICAARRAALFRAFWLLVPALRAR
ncbi:hypothetical protein A2U01_0052517, partial [Trifolium medium]|nr:hypothetical protein [Trifolium medium]